MSATKSSTLIDPTKVALLPPRPLAYLVIWGNRAQYRDVHLKRKDADDAARVLRGQVIPLGEIRP